MPNLQQAIQLIGDIDARSRESESKIAELNTAVSDLTLDVAEIVEYLRAQG